MTLEEKFARAAFATQIKDLTAEQKDQVLLKLWDDCLSFQKLARSAVADNIGMPKEYRKREVDR